MNQTLAGWLWRAQLRAQPGRLLVAALSIAIGVALALAIHLVNRSALDEFDAALAAINGQAQARVEARGASFDESLYPIVAQASAVAAASPVIDALLPVIDNRRSPPADRANDAQPASAAESARARLHVIGIDPMRAAAVTPDLLPTVAPLRRDGDEGDKGDGGGAGSALFADDAIFLSRRALDTLGLQVGDTLRLAAANGIVALRILGTVDRVPADLSIAVMDIGTLQWRLGWLGRLSRIDLRLAPGVTPAMLADPQRLALPPDVIVVTPDTARQRMSNLSRAYRVNLSVLALVALFTGGFIVHAAMSLAVARQLPELALLAVLGARRRFLVRQVLVLGLLPGLAGAALGVLAGVAGARLLLAFVGGDLGGGYFADSSPQLAIDATSLTGFALAGIATALAGSLASVWRIARHTPARGLRGGSVEDLLARRAPWPLALGLLAAGAALLAAPAIDGLPLAAYLAIALWLIAGIALVPRAIQLAARLLRSDLTARAGPSAWLAAQRVASTPGGSGAALGGIVASIALASAMAIMVTSFRHSVEAWLDIVLPAELYVRVEGTGSQGIGIGPHAGIDAVTQRRIASVAGVDGVEFEHIGALTLDPHRAPVALLARPIDRKHPARRLPITGAQREAPPGAIPIWVSEAIVDLYGWVPGSRVALPVGADSQFRPHFQPQLQPQLQPRSRPRLGQFFVAGVWRDYARQQGAIAIGLDDWIRAGGDARITNASIHLAPGARLDAVAQDLREAVRGGPEISVGSGSALRERSLRIFDRSFAATWALEAVAILVALFGVAAAWTAEAGARSREFGVLRHLGVTPAAIVRQFAIEAGTLCAAAVIWGIGIGAAIALVLVHRVNPQSFHWTMDVSWPIGALAGGAAALVALAIVAAAIAARRVGSAAPVRAVREDW